LGEKVMAYIKPGKVIGGFTWTGKRWVKTPDRMSDKVALKKEIDINSKNTEGSGTGARRVREYQMREAKAKYPGGSPDMSRAKATNAPSKKDAAKASTYNKTTAAKRIATKAVATKPTDKPASGSSSSTVKTTAKTPAKKAATVSQSNTEWVKKGDVVNGKTITKGYVAQKGKPERKVTANVKLVVDTARGKAGSKVSYNKGRATKKGK
jgi:hypothetical protein